MRFREFMIMEEEPSALTGGADAPPADAPPADAPPAGDPPPSIYGDLEVKFPEGLDADTQQSTFIKPFVDKETGEINYSNMMKSYVHAQKNMNSSKVVMPTEGSSDQELDEFWEKLGYKADEAEYVLNRAEEAKLSEEQVADIKKFARENRMPLSQAQKLVDYMESKTSESVTNSVQAQADQIKAGLDGLQTEWGQAYEQKLGVAKRVLTEVVKDDSVMEVFADPRIGSNPAVIKALAKIGEGLFKEDGIRGNANNNMLSPEDASIEINKIMGDKSSPYWNKGHASHNDVVAQVNKLFQMKQGRV